MRNLKEIALLAPLAISASITMAYAADMPDYEQPPVIEHRASPVGTGGWYLRGDVGLGITSNSGWSNTDLTAASGRYLTDSMDDAPVIGFGIGYKFNKWVRVDITGEYRGSIGVSAIDQYAFDCDAAGLTGWGSCASGGVIQRNNYWNGQISSTVFMINGYFDLGNFNGLSPFVGAGVGGAYNSFSSLRDHDPGDFGGAGNADANGRLNFAWALHAGLGYAVSDNLTLEASYRYMNLGNAVSGDLNCLPSCGTLAETEIGDIVSHDLRIGMRWMLGAAETPVVDDYPIIRKY